MRLALELLATSYESDEGIFQLYTQLQTTQQLIFHSPTPIWTHFWAYNTRISVDISILLQPEPEVDPTRIVSKVICYSSKAVVAGAAGPASAGPLFLADHGIRRTNFFDRRNNAYMSVFDLPIVSSWTSRGLLMKLSSTPKTRVMKVKVKKTNITGITKRVKTLWSFKWHLFD